MRDWLPFPGLWLSLTALWLLLNESVWIGHVLLGGALAFAACRLYARLESPVPRQRTASHWTRGRAAAALLLDVAVDIVRSNFAVASIVLRAGRGRHSSGFLDIPLELRHRAGLALLACIVTATPGTSWTRFDAERGILTLHILDLVDEAGWSRIIKGRYEARLLEIFE